MQGRDTPSAGLDKSADWLASELRAMGLRGGAEDGGFVQRYPLRAVALDVDESSLSGGDVRLRFGEDLLPLTGAPATGSVVGGLALVSGSANPGTALVGDAVRGKHVVLVLGSDARGVDQSLFRLLLGIRDAGAASVMVTNPVGDEQWAANVGRVLRPAVDKGWGDNAQIGQARFQPLLQIRTTSLALLLEGRGVDLRRLQNRSAEAVEVLEVAGAELALTQRVEDQVLTAPNVVAVLEGSDPLLKSEYVVFSAHMDHVGIGTPDQAGDSIFNGADDDASGTVAVVEVAEAMASLSTPPKRSMLFLLVSGEEKGLWGSEYFAENPSVPIGQIVAALNTDMVGRNWPDTIVAIGKEHSDLGVTLNRVNRQHPELGMTAIDDIWPEENFYFRSDHYNFARKGVPVLFFFNGTHDDYHGRDDEPDRIDAEKAARIARLVFYLGVDIGNAPARPEWNPESYARIAGGGG